MRARLRTLLALFGLVLATPAFAGHHLWDFTEMYSNADGSVQFFELFTADDNEAGVGPFTVTCGANTLNFVTNLSTSVTHNTYILCATSNFAGLPGGVAPDYIIPANFFPTGGGTLNYASGTDVWNYSALVTNGKFSRLRNGTNATSNSPTNFNGNAGSINLAAALPMLPSWGLVALVGALLFAASGLLTRRGRSA